MTLFKKTFPTEPTNPLEIHHWYYRKGEENPVTSVAYVKVIDHFRWEFLDDQGYPVVVASCAAAEDHIKRIFGASEIRPMG